MLKLVTILKKFENKFWISEKNNPALKVFYWIYCHFGIHMLFPLLRKCLWGNLIRAFTDDSEKLYTRIRFWFLLRWNLTQVCSKHFCLMEILFRNFRSCCLTWISQCKKMLHWQLPMPCLHVLLLSSSARWDAVGCCRRVNTPDWNNNLRFYKRCDCTPLWNGS